MKSFVRNVAFIFKVLFVSFISVNKNRCSISHVWLLVNSLKVLTISGYFLLRESFKKEPIIMGSVFYLSIVWINLVKKRKSILQALNSAKCLAEALHIGDQNQEIYSQAKKKCLWFFVALQSPSVFSLFYSTSLVNGGLLKLPYFYTFCLFHSFIIIFFFVSEFVLACLKTLNKSFAVVLKLKTVTLLNDEMTEHQKVHVNRELLKAVENMISYYQEIFELSLKFGEIFNFSTLLSLLLLLLKVVIKVVFSKIFY